MSVGPLAPKLSVQLDMYFTLLGATRPYTAPNWSQMPATEAAHEQQFRDTRFKVVTGVYEAILGAGLGIAILLSI